MAGFPLQQLQVIVQYKGGPYLWYRRVHRLVTKRYDSAGKAGWEDVGNLAGLAGSFVSGGLGGVNLRDGNGIKLSGKVFNVEGISAMNGLAGGLASTAVNFGMTGNATFNLASIKGVGLLEVTIGKDGISSRLGSGGMSLSSETLMLAASGHQEAGKVMDWKYGTDESRSTLNGINQLGYTNIQLNHDLANDIWDEQIGVDYADIAGYGLYKVGEKSITLNSDLLGGGLEESAKLATVLSHEGTHLYGNRIEGIAHFQGATTYMQLLDQFKLAGDETFASEIMAGLTAPSSWVENIGDEDWWRLMKNGDLVASDDGWLKDENGNFILDNDGNKIGDSGKETGLLNILFGKVNEDGTLSYSGREYDSFSDEEIKVAQALMLSAGMKNDGAANFKDVRWISEENENHVISAKEILSEAGNSVATPVFMNALDKASDTVVFEPYLSTNVISSMDYSYRTRFLDYVQAKEDFYFENRLLLDNDPKFVWTQDFAKSDVRDNDGNIIYKDGYHKGIDIAGKMNSPIYAYYSGKVVDEKFNTTSSGYSVVINYGFQFENSFYSTGVSAQFMHFSEESSLNVGDYVSSTTLVGRMGNTGATSGATGVHLHYQLMGDLGGTSADSSNWNMYSDRRNQFLDAFGSTGSMYAGGDYMNYYYDINNLKERLAIR